MVFGRVRFPPWARRCHNDINREDGKMKAKSVQAERKRSMKSNTARLQAKTLKSAFRQGMAWEDDEVAVLVQGIEKDETTFDLAIRLGRSLYGVMGARAHIGFAMRHRNVLL